MYLDHALFASVQDMKMLSFSVSNRSLEAVTHSEGAFISQIVALL